MKTRWLSVAFALAGLLVIFTSLHAGEEIKSGPQVGTLIPGSFDPFNINGEHKGRHHCLVCKYSLNPVVMILAREPAEGKDAALAELLKKVDEVIDKYQENDFLSGFVVILSPSARSSVTETKVEDPDLLVKEAKARDDLAKRLEARAEKLKSLVVTFFPAGGPKGYNLSAKAEVTVVFYNRYKVLANHAFAEGKMTEEDAGEIVKGIEKILVDGKKKPVPAKK